MSPVRPCLVAGLAALLGACTSMQHPAPMAANTPPPAPAPAPAPAAKPAVENVTVDFPAGGAKLTADAKQKLDGAARLYRDAGPEVMIVSGHADPSGREFANVILSAKRAEAVKQGLVDRGIPAAKLQIVAVGTAEPVPGDTPARTAVITWR